MSNLRHHIRAQSLFLIGLFTALGATTACQKLCQQPGQPMTTFTGQEFRLAQTNDPTVKGLSNTNFQTITFASNYTGEIHRVFNNQRQDAPSLTFVYNVDPQNKLIQIQFSTPSGGASSSPAEGSQDPNQVGGTKTFLYTLTSEFRMMDTSNGWYYRYVPFQGIVLPDQACTF